MTTEMHETEADSLGQLLKRIRTTKGLELSQISEETKISSSNLKAMEADDYAALPADAFARGFYSLYARMLDLDADEVVARFLRERGTPPSKSETTPHTPPSHKAAQQVSNMAEPSAVSPVSTLGFILLLMIMLGGGLCWYFDVNPASFISEKMRGFQQTESSETVPGDTTEEQTGQNANQIDKDQSSTLQLPGNPTIHFKVLSQTCIACSPLESELDFTYTV